MSERIYYSKEAAEQARQRMAFIASTAFILGAGVGVMIALLFAPAPGDEIRRNLSNSLEQGYDSGKNAAEGALKEAQKHIS